MRFLITLISICLLPLSATSQKFTFAEQWPQFRGNSQNTAISLSAVPKDLKLLWTFEDGESIESSAAIANGMVFVGTHKSELVALDLKSGAVRWKYAAGDIGEANGAADLPGYRSSTDGSQP
jgi:outer membrane protein assembly factor BamB